MIYGYCCGFTGGEFELSLDFDHRNIIADGSLLFAAKLSAQSIGNPFFYGSSRFYFLGRNSDVLGSIDGNFVCGLSSEVYEASISNLKSHI